VLNDVVILLKTLKWILGTSRPWKLGRKKIEELRKAFESLKERIGGLIGFVVNGLNILLRGSCFNLEDILNAVKSLDRVVALNHSAPQKLIEAVINYGRKGLLVAELM